VRRALRRERGWFERNSASVNGTEGKSEKGLDMV
jgi:hypothetical protein